MSTLTMTPYSDRRDLWPRLARWHHDAWALPGRMPEESEARFVARVLAPDPFPMGWIVFHQGNDAEPIGTVELKRHEMDEVPEREFWLGEVYVVEAERGKGIAAQMVRFAIDQARAIGLPELVLQTARMDGGLYKRLGFEPVRPVWVEAKGHSMLLMALTLTEDVSNS
ncbi:MAG: GNAT family N-acetyltransferase [Alphaproteobacteria bacterium]|nr:GNAT family N-acetyltransferase [Alphaproteobacteria bacterium SS10]